MSLLQDENTEYTGTNKDFLTSTFPTPHCLNSQPVTSTQGIRNPSLIQTKCEYVPVGFSDMLSQEGSKYLTMEFPPYNKAIEQPFMSYLSDTGLSQSVKSEHNSSGMVYNPPSLKHEAGPISQHNNAMHMSQPSTSMQMSPIPHKRMKTESNGSVSLMHQGFPDSQAPYFPMQLSPSMQACSVIQGEHNSGSPMDNTVAISSVPHNTPLELNMSFIDSFPVMNALTSMITGPSAPSTTSNSIPPNSGQLSVANSSTVNYEDIKHICDNVVNELHNVNSHSSQETSSQSEHSQTNSHSYSRSSSPVPPPGGYSSSPPSRAGSPSPSQASRMSPNPSPGPSPAPSVDPGNSPAPPPPMLPPCRICGEKASGFHYGANTCEACKGFFRRSLQRKTEYSCQQSGECQILPGKRSSCAACRYKKCISIGMSKGAIKTGRYTHAKRARDITEVKRLEKVAQLNVSHTPSVAGGGDEGVVCPDTNLDDIIEHLTKAYNLHQSPYTQEFLEKLPEREAKYLEKKRLKEKMFGPLKPIPLKEYQEIYKSTGIDIDGRREIVRNLIPSIERSIKRFITFAKHLPGFKELPMEDQISLVKVSRFDCWMLYAHQAVNIEEMLYTNIGGYTVHKEDILSFDDGAFVEEFFRISMLVKKLQPDQTEIALLSGICILSSDRCTLSNREKVERSQDRLMEALLYHEQKYHPHDPCRIARMVVALTEMRIGEINHSNLEDRLSEWKDLDFPPLVLEMWSS